MSVLIIRISREFDDFFDGLTTEFLEINEIWGLTILFSEIYELKQLLKSKFCLKMSIYLLREL